MGKAKATKLEVGLGVAGQISKALFDAVITLIREIADARAKVLEAKPQTDPKKLDIVNNSRYALDIEVIGNKVVIDEELR